LTRERPLAIETGCNIYLNNGPQSKRRGQEQRAGPPHGQGNGVETRKQETRRRRPACGSSHSPKQPADVAAPPCALVTPMSMPLLPATPALLPAAAVGATPFAFAFLLEWHTAYCAATGSQYHDHIPKVVRGLWSRAHAPLLGTSGS
jgi:hypothetical protein